MTRDVLDEKIESLRRCVQRITDNLPTSAQDFASDLDAQDIIAVNLERVVQCCVDIAASIVSQLGLPSTSSMAGLFDALGTNNIIPGTLASNFIKAVGFRNILVHQYKKIDWLKVHEFASKNLDDFSAFVREVLQWREKVQRNRPG